MNRLDPERTHALNMGLVLATSCAAWCSVFLSFTILGAALVWGIIFLCALVAVVLPKEGQ